MRFFVCFVGMDATELVEGDVRLTIPLSDPKSTKLQRSFERVMYEHYEPAIPRV